MSDATTPPPSDPRPPYVRPARDYGRDQPPPRRRGLLVLTVLLLFFLLGSLGLNLVLFVILVAPPDDEDGANLNERYRAGTKSASNKVAVVRIDGMLMEGMLDYAHQQIDRVAGDPQVKAVVVRIDSPGGTITASDDVHRRLAELRDGKHPRHPGRAKPLVASMGSVAASGGYFVAMPAPTVFAERTTITGSIGVYASLLNVHKFTDKHGVEMKLVKAGDIKASGSPFHEMTDEERQPWQEMVDHAYDQFLGVVEAGRKDANGVNRLKKGLREPIERELVVRDDKGNVVFENGSPKKKKYARKLADGGTYTADEALKFGMIDEIGYLEDAAAAAARAANLGDYKVVMYDRPLTLFNALLGAKAPQPPGLDLSKLAGATQPRLWYLAPNAEVAGLLTAAGRNR